MTNRLLNNKKYANANLNRQLASSGRCRRRRKREERREVHYMVKVEACHVAYEQQHCVYEYEYEYEYVCKSV